MEWEKDEFFWDRYKASKLAQFDPNEPWDFKVEQPLWVLDKLIPARSIGMVYGPSNSGKSHIICDLIATILHGKTEWQGRELKPGSVLMFSESLGHIQARMKAYVTAIPGEMPFKFYSLPNLSLDIRDIDLVQAWIGSMDNPPSVLIFDTLATAFSFDENDNREASKLIAMLESKILPLLPPYSTIIIAHHTSKVSEGKSARGASALIGNIDYSINVMYDKKQNLTIATWEKDRWRLVEEPPVWAGTMHRVPVEFENGSADISILDWKPYDSEAAELADRLAEEIKNQSIRDEVIELIEQNIGGYVHTKPGARVPAGHSAITFPDKYKNRRQEIHDFIREKFDTADVVTSHGNVTGFTVIGRR